MKFSTGPEPRPTRLAHVALPLCLAALMACGDKESEERTRDVGVSSEVTDASEDPTTDGGTSDDAAAGPADAGAPDAAIDGGVSGDGGLDGGPELACAAAPGLTPGEHGCPGCPTNSSPPSSFMQTLGAVTTGTFSGHVDGVEGSGSFEVVGPSGQRIFGPVPVTSGNYSVQLPLFCGAQTVALSFCNTSGTYTLLYAVTTSPCTSPDLRATLSWDDLGRDWELHLIKPGGRINDNATDCTWTSCIRQSPDWGVPGDTSDNPVKDVDNTGLYGPENILLPRAEAGVYTVMVEHWGNGSPLSDGRVILNVLGSVVTVEITDLAPRFVRTAATIEFPMGTVRTSTAVHDCTSNWSGGCRDRIP